VKLHAHAPAAYLAVDEIVGLSHPSITQLAWPVRAELGERDYSQLLASPHPAVVRALRGATDALELCRGGLPSHF